MIPLPKFLMDPVIVKDGMFSLLYAFDKQAGKHKVWIKDGNQWTFLREMNGDEIARYAQTPKLRLVS